MVESGETVRLSDDPGTIDYVQGPLRVKIKGFSSRTGTCFALSARTGRPPAKRQPLTIQVVHPPVHKRASADSQHRHAAAHPAGSRHPLPGIMMFNSRSAKLMAGSRMALLILQR
jgi:hypothetical protein